MLLGMTGDAIPTGPGTDLSNPLYREKEFNRPTLLDQVQVGVSNSCGASFFSLFGAGREIQSPKI